MNRRALVVFVILNVVISIGVALLVIALWSGSQLPQEQVIVQTFVVYEQITSTPGPTQTPWIVTVQSGAPPPVQVPAPGAGEPTVAPTLNPNIIADVATAAVLTQTAFEAGGGASSEIESTYVVQDDDNPSTIAESLGVPLDDLLCANDLGTIDEPELIFPGDVLLVPGPDFICDSASVAEEEEAQPPEETGAEATPESTGEAVQGPLATVSEDLFSGQSGVPTVTLAPTAEDAQVVIAQVIGAGDVTTEGVEIRNLGGLIDMEGWTLYDTQGNIYTFPDYRLFPSGSVTVFSRVGEDTPVALFWRETRAIWQQDDVVSLADADGVVQSTFRIGVDGVPTVPPATPAPEG